MAAASATDPEKLRATHAPGKSLEFVGPLGAPLGKPCCLALEALRGFWSGWPWTGEHGESRATTLKLTDSGESSKEQQRAVTDIQGAFPSRPGWYL